jgi:hypothetical protein
LIAEHQDQLRKEAEAVAYRFRTEPNFDWASAKSDALILVKDASEQAFPVLENYLKSLGSSPGTAHLKIAFVSDPAPQPGMLVEDRFEIVPTIEKVATLVSQLEALQLYDAHIKSALTAAGTNTSTERPPTGFSGNPSLLRLEEVLLPHSTFERSPDEVNQELGKNITQGATNLRELLEKVPNPSQVQKGMLESMVAPFVSSKNKKQMRIDDAVDDAKTRTTVERMLLTDPIIREADPDTVVSLYNTLQQANPEISKDPNLLRFALREAIQYESVPLHTYKDLVETDEKRQKALELSQKNRDTRYNIGA